MLNWKEIGKRLTDLRKKKELQQPQVAELLGLSGKGSISNIEKGRQRLTTEQLADLSKIYRAPLEYILWGEEQSSKEVQAGAESPLTRVPILEDTIAAGPGSDIDFSNVSDWAQVSSWRLKRQHRYYFLRVTGDSMEPLLRKGSLILVNLDRNDPKQLRDRLVAAYLPNENGATVKILREEERGQYWILHPVNPAYKDRVVSKREDEFQIAAVEATYLG